MQKFTDIPSKAKLTDSLAPLLDNDKTALSCNEGTTFPTVKLMVGMLCLRSDLKRLYQLVDLAPSWVCVADLSGNFRHIDGGKGNAIDHSGKSLDSWVEMPSGIYEGVNMRGAPSGDTQWRVLQIRHGNSDGWATQMAFGFSTDAVRVRRQAGGVWTAWASVWTTNNDGADSGLDADLLDGKQSGNSSGQIPVSDGKLNINLNADLLDGKHAGNARDQVPINNGTLNSNLNADLLDGFEAAAFARSVMGSKPDAAGNVVIDLSGKQDARGAITTENLLNQFVDLPASTQKVTTPNASLAFGEWIEGATTVSGMQAGTYSLGAVLRSLSRLSHSHDSKRTDVTNCNCACNCACTDSDGN